MKYVVEVAGDTDIKRAVLVVSDVTIKTLYLHARMNGVSWTEFSNHTIAINDEIDSMYKPTKSELNVPDPESKVRHPMEKVDKQMNVNMFTKVFKQKDK